MQAAHGVPSSTSTVDLEEMRSRVMPEADQRIANYENNINTLTRENAALMNVNRALINRIAQLERPMVTKIRESVVSVINNNIPKVKETAKKVARYVGPSLKFLGRAAEIVGMAALGYFGFVVLYTLAFKGR